MTATMAADPVTRELIAEHGLGDGAVLTQVLERAADSKQWARFDAQLRSCGGCRQPVRLHGKVDAVDERTGECRPVYSTDAEPDATLLKCCGNRREAVCPSCAETYRGDAYQLVAAGLRGGKGVPETVSEHPLLFVTLTAPSFGSVHTRRAGPEDAARALPAATRRAGVPARGPALVRRGARRGRSAARRAAVRGVLRLRAGRTVERGRARAVAADRDPDPARPCAPVRPDAEGAARARARLVRQGRRVPASRRAALPPGRAPRRRPAARPRRTSAPAAGEVHARAARAGRAPRGRRRRGALPRAGRRTGHRCEDDPLRLGDRDPTDRARRGASTRARALDTSRSTRQSRRRRSAGLRAASTPPTWRACACVRTCGRMWSARGGSGPSATCTGCGCGAGRTCSASAGTASRRAGATRRRSRRCAAHVSSTCCASAIRAGGATPGAVPSPRAPAASCATFASWAWATGRRATRGLPSWRPRVPASAGGWHVRSFGACPRARPGRRRSNGGTGR